jgi:hypothetical protein
MTILLEDFLNFLLREWSLDLSMASTKLSCCILFITVLTPVRIRYTNSMFIAEFKNEFRGAREYFGCEEFFSLKVLANSQKIYGSLRRIIDWTTFNSTAIIVP